MDVKKRLELDIEPPEPPPELLMSSRKPKNVPKFMLKRLDRQHFGAESKAQVPSLIEVSVNLPGGSEQTKIQLPPVKKKNFFAGLFKRKERLPELKPLPKLEKIKFKPVKEKPIKIPKIKELKPIKLPKIKEPKIKIASLKEKPAEKKGFFANLFKKRKMGKEVLKIKQKQPGTEAKLKELKLKPIGSEVSKIFQKKLFFRRQKVEDLKKLKIPELEKHFRKKEAEFVKREKELEKARVHHKQREQSILEREKKLEKEIAERLARLKAMEDGLAEKGKLLNKDRSELVSLRNSLSKISVKERAIQRKIEEIARREDALRAREIEVDNKEKVLNSKEKAISQHAVEISRKELEAERRLQRAVQAEKNAEDMENKTKQIIDQRVKAKLSELGDIENKLKQDLAYVEEKQSKIRKAQELKVNIALLEKKLSAADKEYKQITEKLDKKKSQHAEFEKSMSQREAKLLEKERELDKQIDLFLEVKRPLMQKEKPLGPKTNELLYSSIEDCKQLIGQGNFEEAKKLYDEILRMYNSIRISDEEKKEIYFQISELYNEIHLGLI